MIVRVEGITELVGDLLLHPATGVLLLQPGQIPTPNFFALPANLPAQPYYEALLLIDQPGSGLTGHGPSGFRPLVPAPPSAPPGQNASQTVSRNRGPLGAPAILVGNVRANSCPLGLPVTPLTGGSQTHVTSPFQRDTGRVLNTIPIYALIGPPQSAAHSPSLASP